MKFIMARSLKNKTEQNKQNKIQTSPFPQL